MKPSDNRSFVTVDRVGRVCLTDGIQLSVQNAFEIRTADFSKFTAEQKLACACGSRYYDASPDGRLAVIHDWDQTLSIWDLRRNECVKQFTVAELQNAIPSIPDGLNIESVRFLPNSRRIAIDLCHAIVTYDLESGASTEWLISTDKSKHYYLPSAPFVGSRALIRQGWGSPALLMETDQPGTVREIGGMLSQVCWGHDGTYIIECRTNGIIVVTDVATGKEKHRFIGGSTANPAISPDGRTLALHQGTEIVLCNILSGRELVRIPIAIRGEKAVGLRFSDRGRRLTADFQYVHRWQNSWQLDPSVYLSP